MLKRGLFAKTLVLILILALMDPFITAKIAGEAITGRIIAKAVC